MFSGIVQETGKVKEFLKQKDIYNLSIDCSSILVSNLQKGASIAVNGVCLTVKDTNPEILRFDLVEETIERTNFSDIKAGDSVNLERSLKMGDELGGHLVSGHIHGTGEVLKVINRKETKDLLIKIPSDLKEYFFYKGYVALNGCSLTIGKVLKSSFYIHLIPETVSITTFKEIKKGDLVNIEVEQTTINTVETVKRVMLERKA